MDTLIHDLRYALRAYVRNPGFTVVAVASLALGIGANVVIFSVANAVLEKPIGGAADAGRLVRVYRGTHSPLAYQDFRYFNDSVRSLSGMVAERLVSVSAERDGEAVAIQAAAVAGNYFAALGVRPAVGQLFAAGAQEPVVVLSHRYWQRELGSDPSIIGRSLALNETNFTVIGIASPDFTSSVPLWNPAAFIPFDAARPILGTDPGRWNGSVYVTGRLAARVDRATAQAEFDVRTRQLIASREGRDSTMTVQLSVARGVIAEIRQPAAIASGFLLVVVSLVLLIACANVANLLLARATSRRREMGVRLAIGASRTRVVRQLLTESVVLALLGGAAAFVASVYVTRAIGATLIGALPIEMAVSFAPDMRVLAYTVGLSLLTATIFGLAPALQSVRHDLVTALRDDADRSGYRRSRLRSALVVGQVVACTVLVAGSTLFLRSLLNAKAIDPGFPIANITDVAIDLGPRQLDDAEGAAFYDRLLEEMRAIPGVQSATIANIVPLSGSNNQTAMWLQGAEAAEGQRPPQVYFNVVATDYMRTLRIPIVRGREAAPTDVASAPPVAVVNETMARRFWPNGDALGRRFSINGPTGPWVEVVGIARDTRYNSLGETTPPFVYLPLAQNHMSSVVLQIRTIGPAGTVADAVRRTVRSLDPQLPAVRPVPLETDMQVALLPAKLGAALLGAFGGLALLLATVGIYGVASFAVARRTREIGIRSALGAQRIDVLRMVVGESMRRVGIGLSLGLLGALGFARLVSSQLYGVGAVDPITFTVTPLVLGAVAFAASWIPAMRAAKVSPMTAIRD